MASLERTASGKWKIRWREGTRQRSRTLSDKAEAQRLLWQAQIAEERGERLRPAGAGQAPLVAEVINTYLTARASVLSRNSLISYASALGMWRDWLEGQLGAPRIDELTRALLRAYLEHLEEREISRASVRHYMKILHHFWAWAHEHDDEYGWAKVPRPRRVELGRAPRRAPPVAPTWAQIDAMIEHLPLWALPIALLLRCTGMRKGAAAELRWTDLGEAVTVRAEVTKGGYGGRRFPVPPVLAELLEGWPRSGPQVAPLTPFRRRYLSRYVRRAWEAAGVPSAAYQGRPVHALRRGFITGQLEAGAQADAVEYIVGHSLGAVRSRYVDPSRLRLAEAVAKVPPLSVSLRERWATHIRDARQD